MLYPEDLVAWYPVSPKQKKSSSLESFERIFVRWLSFGNILQEFDLRVRDCPNLASFGVDATQ